MSLLKDFGEGKRYRNELWRTGGEHNCVLLSEETIQRHSSEREHVAEQRERRKINIMKPLDKMERKTFFCGLVNL